LDDQDDQGDHEDEMNQRSNMDDGEPEQPENQKHNEEGPEHMFSFELVYFASFAGRRPRLKIFENPRAS
jgi:hypothetical protein